MACLAEDIMQGVEEIDHIGRTTALVHEYTLGCKRDEWMAMLLPGR